MKKVEGNKGIIQFVKFAVVGLSNTAVDWIVYYALINTLLSESAEKSGAKAISFVAAVVNSYIWNSIWTFRKEYKDTVGSRADIGKKSSVFMRFFVVSLIGWGINYLVFRVTLENIVNRDIIALVFASGAAVIWNFFANKFWTYKK